MSDAIFEGNAVYGGEHGRKGVWHGKGFIKLNECLTMEEVKERMPKGIATVTKVPLFSQREDQLALGEDGEIVQGTSFAAFQGAYGTQATWKDGSTTDLGVVGNQYQVIQDSWVLEDIPHDLIKAGEAVFDGVMYLHGACVFVVLLRLPDEVFSVDDGSQIEPYLLLVNSHDGSKSLTCMLTTVRVVCQNTLTMAFSLGSGKIRITHSGNVKAKTGEAARLLGLARDEVQAQKILSDRMVRHRMTKDQKVDYIHDVLGIDTRDPKLTTRNENIVLQLLRCLDADKYADPNSVWGMFNAVTNYVDHHKSVSVTSRSVDADQAKAHSVFLGHGQTIKANAWKAARTLVNA